jgi:hypothetical protein
MTEKPSTTRPIAPAAPAPAENAAQPAMPEEIGGSKLPLEPTRYGDWERNGRCYDF